MYVLPYAEIGLTGIDTLAVLACAKIDAAVLRSPAIRLASARASGLSAAGLAAALGAGLRLGAGLALLLAGVLGAVLGIVFAFDMAPVGERGAGYGVAILPRR